VGYLMAGTAVYESVVFPSGAGLRGPQELGVSLGRRPSRASGVQDRTRPSRQARGKQPHETLASSARETRARGKQRLPRNPTTSA
jgi:hypothetical protein